MAFRRVLFRTVAVSSCALGGLILARKPDAPRRVMISGGPGSGKGTQSELIVEKYKVVHVSTGDLLRDEIQRGTEEGKKAKPFMDAGSLVPQEVMAGIVKKRLTQPDCLQRGWLLDGYPRDVPASTWLMEQGLIPDLFLVLDVPDDVLVARLSGRLFDPLTGHTYHKLFMPPPDDPVLRARLKQRDDDTEATAKVRIAKYHALIDPVLAFYRGRKIPVQTVNGNQSADKVFKDVTSLLDGL